MSNAYDSMAGAFSSGKVLGWTAFGSSLVACSVWPELLLPIPADKSGFLLNQLGKVGAKWNLNRSMSLGGQTITVTGGVLTSVPLRLKLIITDTGKMLEACSRIHESGSAGKTYLEALNDQYYSITPDVWQANDQEAYSERLRKYRDSVQNTYCLAWETAALTAVVGSLRFIQMAIACALAGVLAILAAAFWIAVAIPFGQGVAVSIRNAGQVIARMLPRVIRIMDEIMVKVGQAHAALVAVRTFQAGISDSIRLGDAEGYKDMGDAALETLGDMLKKLSKGQVNVLTGF
ncbi:hypothetical protein [Actinopolymorpha alba]|uniref:hypothetical protein n=1 Tax=Actinopolymorpha alba TaxID=533267 RepID=UPI00036C21AB|nr:hypothetical protein [Actinopolymorpha alba]